MGLRVKRQRVFVLLAFLSIVVGSVSSEIAYEPFDETKYGSDYAVSKCEIHHGKAVIRITQVKAKTPSPKTPHCCRAWLTIERNGKTLFQRYYGDIEPVGGSYGLFIPQNQPPSPYFAIVKHGDYDGRLFLVHKSGEVHDLKGGSYFVTTDKRYLFSEYVSDLSGLEVFDLRTGKTVFTSGEDFPYIYGWYEIHGEYFFLESDSLRKKALEAYFIDPAKGQMTKQTLTAEELSVAKKIDYDFDAKSLPDCDCSDDPGEGTGK